MKEITKTEVRSQKSVVSRQKTENRIVCSVLFFVILFVYFFALDIPLLGPDESRYAQVAREMFERNDFVTPTLGGFNWFEKPALLYWLQIVFYKMFGVSEFAARFGSALFGLGTIFSLWILGRFYTAEEPRRGEEKENQETKNEDQRPNNDFANWLALIAASSVGLLAFSRGASFDIILTFPITASLVSFFIFDLKQRKPNKPHINTDEQGLNERTDEPQNKSLFASHFSLFAFYFFIGVAMLAKGLIGIVFPLAIVAFYFVLSRRVPSKTFVFSLFWGLILSFLVAASWYAPMYLRHGWTFVDEFFLQHHFARYASNKYQHPQPFWFFFVVLPLMTVPWLPFFAASIWNFAKRFFQLGGTNDTEKKVSKQSSQLLIFAFSWLLVPLVFFSFSGSKLPGYILPAVPAALIFTAEYVSGFVRKSRAKKLFLQILAFATFAVVAIILQFYLTSFAQTEIVKNLVEIADKNGYENEKIFSFNTISHNAEFYAAARLVRTVDGKQRYFFRVEEIVEEAKRDGGKDVLVFAPLESVNQLTKSDLIEAKVLGDNTELAIVAVKIK